MAWVASTAAFSTAKEVVVSKYMYLNGKLARVDEGQPRRNIRRFNSRLSERPRRFWGQASPGPQRSCVVLFGSRQARYFYPASMMIHRPFKCRSEWRIYRIYWLSQGQVVPTAISRGIHTYHSPPHIFSTKRILSRIIQFGMNLIWILAQKQNHLSTKQSGRNRQHWSVGHFLLGLHHA